MVVFDNGAPLGGTGVNRAGAWSFTAAGLADGVRQLSVQVIDAVGNASPLSAPLAVTVDSTGRLANPLTDVSPVVGVTLRKAKKRGSPMVQVATLVNKSGRALRGPVFLVLHGLKKKTRLRNAAGTTGGSPDVAIDPGVFAPGASRTLTLSFKGTLSKFTPSVLAGFGTP